MRSHLLAAVLVLAVAAPLLADMDLYLGPSGGWAPQNKNRTIPTEDGKQLAATMDNSVVDLIQRTKPGGTIKIAMYAFSSQEIMELFYKACFEKGIKVKLILDGVAVWTAGMRKQMIEEVKARLAAQPVSKRWMFQIKVIYGNAFRARDRVRRLDTGETIFGTMHEKFGIFYQPYQKIPFDCFNGSSNISKGANDNFSENRFVFRDDPVVARQFAEEFARLWNEFGTDMLGNAEAEMYVPAESAVGGVRVIFNGEPIDEERYHRIDEALLQMLEKVRYKDGTIDIFMFSWTHFQLAEKVLELAQRYPTIKIRILQDQTQLIADDNHKGILGPYLEEQAAKLGLKNIEQRYKFRANLYAWETPEMRKGVADAEGGGPSAAPAPAPAVTNQQAVAAGMAEEASKTDPSLDGVPGVAATTQPKVDDLGVRVAAIHWRNLILHHKVLIVNRTLMAAGSYNWSQSAERRNLENVMLFNGAYPGHQRLVDRLLAEFDLLWASAWKPGPYTEKCTRAQTITGPEGRELTKRILEVMNQTNMQPVMEFLDKNDARTLDEIVQATRLGPDVVRKNLEALVKAGLVYAAKKGRGTLYGLSD